MNIDSIKRCALIGAVLIGTSLSLAATADSHGGGHGGGWHSGGPAWWGVGIGLGLGWEAAHIASPYYYPAYPVYYYPAPAYYYPYRPATVVIEPTPPMPPERITTGAPSSPPPAPNWYYCDSAKGYYPYVRQCPEPWRTVPSTPPGSIR